MDMQTTTFMESSSSQSTIPVNPGLQQFSSTIENPLDVFLPSFNSSMPVYSGPQQLLSSVNNQAEAIGPASLPLNLGSFQLTSTIMQSLPMESAQIAQIPIPDYSGLSQLIATNRCPPRVQQSFDAQAFRSANMGLQPSPLASKRPLQASPKFQNKLSINQASQALLSSIKRPAQTDPLPKVPVEPFESVRLKLKESLVAALEMVSPRRNNTPQIIDNDNTTTQSHTETGSVQHESHSVTTNTAPSGSSNEQWQKCDDTNSNSNKSDRWSGAQKYQLNQASIDDEMPPRNSSITQDELLLGHGLSWASELDTMNPEAILDHDSKRPKLSREEVSGDAKVATSQIPEILATKIESELFRLFGGVNKKYKEKGRSLLFNLKDRNNPELRERVLSGELPPERLCSMTAEELASKELSQWRLAKAEELAHMVILQDSNVDMRRLVKKTHKGEIQVVMEEEDSVSVEVGLDVGVASKIPTKTKSQAQPKSMNKGYVSSKPNETKATEVADLLQKADSGGHNMSSNAHIKTDVMQEYMIDELKDPDSLRPVVSLDEFMEALDKEPPFDNLPVSTEEDQPKYAENLSGSLEPDMGPESDSSEPKLRHSSESSETKLKSSQYNLEPNKDTHTVPQNPAVTATDNTGSLQAHSGAHLTDIASKAEGIWEGVLQLNIAAPATVIGFFRSGERTSTEEWPRTLEIKGRVRLDAFEKFLQELPLSRSRAIMVAQFCWKEDSPESGRLHLCETANSYVADGRVGFAEPAPGVELYLCPPHPSTSEILAKHLPKDYLEGLQSAKSGLVGVVVWRRPYVNVSHKKHRKQSGSRKQQNAEPSNTPLPANPRPEPENETLDDVPPGFGPRAANRDEDDLPEFNFVHGSSNISVPPPGMRMTSTSPLPPARPVEHMRDLVQKYGLGSDARKPTLEFEPWDDDDDDIPEWQPHQVTLPQALPQPPPPPPLPAPPPPFQQQFHVYQQQPMQPFDPNQHYAAGSQVQLMPHPPPQRLVPLAAPLPMPLQPQVGFMPGQQNMQFGWQQQQQPQWWPPANGPSPVGFPVNGSMQPCHFGGQPTDGGQFNGMPGQFQSPMGWRPDLSRGRGG